MDIHFGSRCDLVVACLLDDVVKRCILNEKIAKKEKPVLLKFRFTVYHVNMLRSNCLSVYFIERADRNFTITKKIMNNL